MIDRIYTLAQEQVADRQGTYGPPAKNFERCARLWSAWLIGRGLITPGTELTPRDVAMLNILQKCSRLAETPDHEDSIVDIIGYANCYGEVGE
jgi:hypothetical protein